MQVPRPKGVPQRVPNVEKYSLKDTTNSEASQCGTVSRPASCCTDQPELSRHVPGLQNNQYSRVGRENQELGM